MDQYNVYQAKTLLSELLTRAENGDEIVIARSNRPVAKLVPYREPAEGEPRKLGQWKGKVVIADDFDDLPPELSAAFNGEEPPRAAAS
ncbi:MAG: type II toxin-antitoxin system prevent-host-death family antitoxin [Candidatus Nanopelagicales bacterium]|nr:type II toxin-antitoxin system prevent-host-death family antitoxin [Candidatus Nanopelagicales bacterium]